MREVEPKGATGNQHQGLQQGYVGEEPDVQRQSFMVAYLETKVNPIEIVII